MPTKLDFFLDGNPKGVSDTEKAGRKVTEKDKPFNLWSFENKQKWFINSDDADEFYKLYFADLRNSIPRYLTEKSTPIGQLRVDLDFKYKGDVESHKHTQQQVIAFATAYMEEVKRYVEVSDVTSIYVLEKDNPTYDPTKDMSSSGIHIQIPSIKTSASVEQSIRRKLVTRMEEFFPDLGLIHTWDKVYDASPLTHTNNWPLLGSRKPGDTALPYRVRYLLDCDPESGEMSVDDDTTTEYSIDLIRKMSVRSKNSEASALTEFGEQNTRPPPVEQTRSVSRGRSDTRDPTHSARASSPGRQYVEPLTQPKREYIKAHLNNLSAERHINYELWIDVGFCLKNIHFDLEDEWLDFSAKHEKFNEREARSKWSTFGFRAEGERLSEKSLRWWSREDNRDGYDDIEKSNVNGLIDISAAAQTDYDFAMVVYAKYRDEFKCASYINNDWYYYVGHIWKNSEKGVELLRRLSSDVAKLYLEKEMQESAILSNLDPCSHKEPDMSCDVCCAEKRKKQFMTARMKLKSTALKSNVMRECQILFFDAEFGKKLDDNKHLLAFNNGIFDTLTQTFREGRPEDCISFCTKVDYNPEKKHHEYACWDELNTFLHRVLPNTDVREYFLKHLATCLSGVFQPRFHIMTGTGSNGKSMIMNLMGQGMGDYCYKVNIALFTQKRNKAGAAQPELMRMRGRRFVFMSEPDEGEPLSTGVLKELTSAEKITCRDLFAGSKQMIEFDVHAKFHLACNDKPTVNTTDGGTWRRLKVVHFPSKFIYNPNPANKNEYMVDESIQQKVLSDEWATCFMNYLIHVYSEGRGLQKLVAPREVDSYTSEYQEDSDVLAQFMRDFIHPVETELAQGTNWNTIATTFDGWKRTHNAMNASVVALKKRIIATYGPLRKGVGYTKFRFGDDE